MFKTMETVENLRYPDKNGPNPVNKPVDTVHNSGWMTLSCGLLLTFRYGQSCS